MQNTTFKQEGFLFHLNNSYNFFSSTNKNVKLMVNFNMELENEKSNLKI